MLRGLRDYVRKNGFKQGRARPVGRHRQRHRRGDRRRCARAGERPLPSCCPIATPREDSLRDAKDCAARLGVRYDIVPIGKPVDEALHELQPVFGNAPQSTSPRRTSSRACAGWC